MDATHLEENKKCDVAADVYCVVRPVTVASTTVVLNIYRRFLVIIP